MAVLTFDESDFLKEHRHSADHFGIIVAVPEPDFDAQARRIDRKIRDRIRKFGTLRGQWLVAKPDPQKSRKRRKDRRRK
ncbi:MAG TPA: hypothetical protein VML55_01775 [Planctomycetaceae bacterium]|nr:hypothetical protein [Planctomycetaceae bacterium]